jgi:CSLREA domain-containing protein
MRIVVFVVTAVVATVASAPRAHATTYTVNSTADAVDQTPGDDVCATAGGTCTLRAAVQEANAHAGADVVTLPPGTFVLGLVGSAEDLAATGDLDVTEELEVRGAGMGASIVDGLRSDRLFNVLGVTFTLRDLTLRNGTEGGAGGAVMQPASGAMTIERVAFVLNSAGVGGAVLQSDGPLTIADSVFTGNSASTGGAVLVAGAAALTVTNSTFTGNVGTTGGALLAANTGTATIQGCTFSGHRASTGATLLATGGALTLTDSTFEQNVASSVAAGPLYSGAGDVVFTNVRALGNTADQAPAGYVTTGGGFQLSGGEFSDNVGATQLAGLFVQATTDVVVQNGAFRRNGSFGAIGGLFAMTSASMSVIDVEARENSATTGGGIYLVATGALTLTRVRAVNNGAGVGPAGGIYATAGTDLTVTDSTIDGNIAGQIGGAYLIAGGAATVTGSTISNNRAAGPGVIGGAYLIASNPSTVVNTTFSGNVADVQVGGVYNGGDFTYRNVTFVGNDAPVASAIFNSGTLSLTSSIVAGPAADHCNGAAITSLGFNIDSTTTCTLAHATDRSNVDPQLGPLQDNGGPTFTHLAGTGSPALDTGNPTDCPATDQRGQPRPTDADGDGAAACDVGATEFLDLCPSDPNKTEPGACGCGVADLDVALANGVADCFVNGELKARIAHGKEMVSMLTGDATDDAMAQELTDMTAGLGPYMTAHPDLQLTGTKPTPSKLVKRLGKAVKRAVRARAKKLVGAKKKAVKAFDALDALVAPQA